MARSRTTTSVSSCFQHSVRGGVRPTTCHLNRRSNACRLLLCLCYLVGSQCDQLFSGVFACVSLSKANLKPLVQRRVGTATVDELEQARTKSLADVDELQPVSPTASEQAETIQPATRGPGPFGIKYKREKQNASILAGLLLFASFLIFRQDIITIFALYEYSSTMEDNWLQTSAMVLARFPTDLISSYGEAAIENPVLTKAATSAVAYFVGDILAQVFQGRIKLQWLDLSRCWRNAAAGFVLHGPALHFWIQFLEGPFSTYIGATAETSNAPWVIASKILMDQTIFAFALNFLYAAFVGFLAAKPLGEVIERTKATVGPSMLSSWRFWPLVHIITYSPFMPVEFKVLWNDAAEIAWVAILSVIANDRREEMPESKKVCVTEDFCVMPEVEITLVSEKEVMG